MKTDNEKREILLEELDGWHEELLKYLTFIKKWEDVEEYLNNASIHMLEGCYEFLNYCTIDYDAY